MKIIKPRLDTFMRPEIEKKGKRAEVALSLDRNRGKGTALLLLHEGRGKMVGEKKESACKGKGNQNPSFTVSCFAP